MNYKKIYDNLIHNRRRNIPTGYFERHHIIPRSLGGTDDKSNIVALTAREHFIAHLLLVKIHQHTDSYYKMLNALVIMKASNKDQRYTSRLYDVFKKEYITLFKIKQVGAGNNQYGTKWIINPDTKEVRKHVGEIPEGWEQGRRLKKTYKRNCKFCFEIFLTNSRKKILCSTECRKKERTKSGELYGKEDDFLKAYHELKSMNKALKAIGSSVGAFGKHYYWAKQVLKDNGM